MNLGLTTLCLGLCASSVIAAQDILLMGTVGQVEIRRNPSGPWEKIQSGTVLELGQAIRTGSKSQAAIRFDTGMINLYSNTLLELPSKPRRVDVNDDSKKLKLVVLHQGRLFLKLFNNKRMGSPFEVISPDLIAEVSQGSFWVFEEEEMRAVFVVEGSANLINRHCREDFIRVKARRYTLLLNDRLTEPGKFQPGKGSFIEKEIVQHLMKATAEDTVRKDICSTDQGPGMQESFKSPKGSDIQRNLSSTRPFQWIASLTLLNRYDDNPTFVSVGEESDLIMEVAPRLRLISSSAALTGDMEYHAVIEHYEENTNLNTVKHFTDMNWTAHLSEEKSFTLEDHFAFTTDSTEFPTVMIAVPRGDAYGNDLSAGFRFSAFNLSYQQGDQHFDSSQLLDTVSRTLKEEVSLPLTAHQWITQSYLLRFYRQWEQDSYHTVLRSHTAGMGLRHYFSPTFFVGAEGGAAHWRTPSDAAFRSSAMIRLAIENELKLNKDLGRLNMILSYVQDIERQWLASLEYHLEKTTLAINFSREITLGGGLLVRTVLRQGAGVQLEKAVGKTADFTLGGSYAHYESMNGDHPRFITYLAMVGFDYNFANWLKAQAHYSFFLQDSTEFAGLHEFSRNQAMLNLIGAFP